MESYVILFMRQKLFLTIYLLGLGIRFINIILFLINPLLGWLIGFIIDTLDYAAALRGGIKYLNYQKIDKTFDILFLIYILISAFYFHFPDLWIFVLFFILRLIGSLLFYLTKSAKYLIYFPNVLEFFFPIYIVYLHQNIDNKLIVIILLIICLIIKLGHEYLLHSRYYIDRFSLAYIKNHPEHGRDINQYN